MNNEIKIVENHIELPEAVRFALQKLKEFQITKQEMDNQERCV